MAESEGEGGGMGVIARAEVKSETGKAYICAIAAIT